MMSAMRLHHELAYDAPPADVLAMLADPLFWDRVAEATGALSSTATVGLEGTATRIVVDQQQVVAGVPSFAKKFVGDSTRAITTQVWQGNAASVQVDTPGKPTSMSGTATLAENGTGSTLTYDLEVKASVPLIGGKLEKLVVELTTDGYDKEQAVGAAWLAGDRA
ncbi:carbon monoxide dehydrogenase subunit G [Marmoricola sp. URHA0025 HA25]